MPQLLMHCSTAALGRKQTLSQDQRFQGFGRPLTATSGPLQRKKKPAVKRVPDDVVPGYLRQFAPPPAKWRDDHQQDHQPRDYRILDAVDQRRERSASHEPQQSAFGNHVSHRR